ncbi:hypothetical protein DPMN_021241 [Dreissena polymorpha]|uniref:Uncharacterized protein n=1 Tax=Dreissena polymorpha TaxID=45954 RepID=A0A9D4NNV9_DREPO|nr:hypothetical protein DPMN_021241 [Dreissena polymorpha]
MGISRSTRRNPHLSGMVIINKTHLLLEHAIGLLCPRRRSQVVTAVLVLTGHSLPLGMKPVMLYEDCTCVKPRFPRARLKCTSSSQDKQC